MNNLVKTVANPPKESEGRVQDSRDPGKEFDNLMRVGKSDDKRKKKSGKGEEESKESEVTILEGLSKKAHLNQKPSKKFTGKKQEVSASLTENIIPAAVQISSSVSLDSEELDAPSVRQVDGDKGNGEEVSLESEDLVPTQNEPFFSEEQKEGEDVQQQPKEIDPKTHQTEQKQQKKEEAIQPTAFIAPSLKESLFVPPPSETVPLYTMLNSVTFALFERIGTTIQTMHLSGVSETSIQLDFSEFSSSLFNGAQVIIREVDTAPFVYNIEFVGSPQAVALFEQHAPDLMAAFRQEDRRFTINRIDASLNRSKKPLVSRKEREGSKEQGFSQSQ